MGGYQHPLDVSNMLDIAINTLAARIVELGDGPLVNGRFLGSAGIGPGLNLVLRAANTNNHQTTRGVLRAALVALRGYMQEWGFGEVFLLIFDGQTLVGKAAIITEPAGA
ncbi:MAG: hypothetical protein FRX48_05543 [Lasallia pustulata]|uniref:Uncharacterized protein n=1 Tax=Lasallia pustulata TaxID=136370 RepID=A0A5M8PMD2_9LECA|nr:MAG: hypothetical protein FRX48_05543 [Lasallia pustulata]